MNYIWMYFEIGFCLGLAAILLYGHLIYDAAKTRVANDYFGEHNIVLVMIITIFAALSVILGYTFKWPFALFKIARTQLMIYSLKRMGIKFIQARDTKELAEKLIKEVQEQQGKIPS